jgi:putative transposase
MGKAIRIAGKGPGTATKSKAGEFAPFGGDDLADALRARVRQTIEAVIEEELSAALGALKSARQEERRGYRNGHVERELGTSLGKTTVSVPRARLFTQEGSQEWHSSGIRRYQRRMADVDNAIISTYLSGVNTRRLRGALRPLLREVPLSKSTVSRVVARLKEAWEDWRKHSLRDVEYAYLFLDGFHVKARCAGRVSRLCVLGVVGVRADGSKEVLALDVCGAESDSSWGQVLDDLAARGLNTPKLCVIDGCAGLTAAIEKALPKTKLQRCAVHKLRNILDKAPKHAHEALKDDFHAIVYADNERAARAAYKRFVDRWSKQCKAAVESLEEAGDHLLTFYAFPPSQWRSLRTTNIIERLNEEFRRRVKTQCSLPSENSVSILLYGLLATGNIIMRKIDGHQDLPAVLRATRNTNDLKDAA